MGLMLALLLCGSDTGVSRQPTVDDTPQHSLRASILFAPAPLPKREKPYDKPRIYVGQVLQMGHYKVEIYKIDADEVFFQNLTKYGGSRNWAGGNVITVDEARAYLKEPWPWYPKGPPSQRKGAKNHDRFDTSTKPIDRVVIDPGALDPNGSS